MGGTISKAVTIFPFFLSFFFFSPLFWLPSNIWNSQARDWIQAVLANYTKAAVRLDP